MVKAYVINGLGIGCHEEAAHAYRVAGAEAEVVHIRELLSGEKPIKGTNIINFSGGFLHGDILGAGMCAANELEHAKIKGESVKEKLVKFAESDGVIYGQCNGFQLLVRTGLLPGIGGDYSKQTVTLTHNDCGSYRVGFTPHISEFPHFAFKSIMQHDFPLYLWCRHGEGKLQFYSENGLVDEDDARRAREAVNENHVLLRYINPETGDATTEFPHNPNGSIDGIAGLVNDNDHIFGHMAHTEAGIYRSRDPEWFGLRDACRRCGIPPDKMDELLIEGDCKQIFENIVNHVR
jgi:phosphoribosylformylglycinamidine synthase subunit PurQ / glutaminase